MDCMLLGPCHVPALGSLIRNSFQGIEYADMQVVKFLPFSVPRSEGRARK
jgi:hypothetical protein